jgi:WD40 repeat protein
MPMQEDIDAQQELLNIARRNVRILLRQIQGFVSDSNAPAHLFVQLEENREKIAQIKVRLRSLGAQVKDDPDDFDKSAAPRQPGRRHQADPDDAERGQSRSTGTPDLDVDWPSSTKPFYLNLGQLAQIVTFVAVVFFFSALVRTIDFRADHPTIGPATRVALATSEPSPVVTIPTPTQPAPSPTLTPLTTARVSLTHTLVGHTGPVWGARFSPEDNTAFTSGEDGLIRHWNTRSGLEIDQYGAVDTNEARMGSLAVSPNGTLVAGAYIRDGSDKYGEGLIHLYQVADGELLRTFTGHTAYVWTVAFSPDGKHLASGSADGTIRLWNVDTGAEEGVLRGHTTLVASVAYSSDGTRLASVSYDDNSLRIWDIGSSKQMIKAAIDTPFTVAWPPDEAYVVASSSDHSIHIINANNGSLARTIKTPDYPRSLAISPNGQLIAGGCNVNTICLWDFQTGAQLAEFGKNSPNVISWNYDGTLLIEGSNNQQARIWSVEY